jgi:hypothetical protein
MEGRKAVLFTVERNVRASARSFSTSLRESSTSEASPPQPVKAKAGIKNSIPSTTYRIIFSSKKEAVRLGLTKSLHTFSHCFKAYLLLS